MEMNENKNPLRQYLNNQGFTIAQFSRLSKIPSPTLSHVLSGKYQPRLSTLRKICKAAGGKITLSDFGIE